MSRTELSLSEELLACERSAGQMLSNPLSNTPSNTCGTEKADVTGGTHIRGIQAMRPNNPAISTIASVSCATTSNHQHYACVHVDDVCTNAAQATLEV